MGAHYFESQGDQERFVQELRSGEISLKWAYSGSAAHTHDALGKSEGYSANSDASSLEAQLVCTRRQRAVSVVDIGPGNSMHSESLWRRVDPAMRPDRYLLLDFSRDLAALCRFRLKRRNAALADCIITTESWDFELGRTDAVDRWREDSSVLALLIGHTIGNPSNPVEVMRNIRNSLRQGDELLLSLSLRTNDLATLDSYSSSQVFRAAATEPFRMAGLDVTPDDLCLRVDKEGSIVGTVELGNSRPLGVPKVVTCFRSRRFDESQVVGMIESAELSISELVIDGSHLASLVLV